ncbi:MAG: FHA domain-containing protein [Bdellovibrio sp.]
MNRFTVTIHRKDNALTHELSKDSFTIGRSLDCDLSLNDTHVSRVHLIVSRRSNQIWIEDKNSSNGTFVNGAKIEQGTPVNVVPADRIQLGRSEFILVIDLETDELPQPEPVAILKVQVPAAKPVVGKTARSAKVEEAFSPAAPVAEPAPAVIPAAAPEPNHENTIFMPPPAMAPAQAEKILHDAKHKAAQIILEGETQAEKRTQAIYQKARDAQAQAEIFYQTRMSDAHKEADAILADFQQQGQQLLHDARNMAQELRDEVEIYVQTLREKAKRDVADLIAEGTLKAEKMKTEALETARSLVQTENENKVRIAQEEADRILELAKTQAQQAQDQLNNDKMELAALTESLTQLKADQADAEKRLESLRVEAEQTKQTLTEERDGLKKSIESELAQLNSIKASLNDFGGKNKEADEQFKKLQEKNAHLTMDIRDLEAKKDQLFKDYDAQKVSLSEKLEKEKAQMEKSEEQRIEEMRLDASKRLQKLEQNLIEDVMAKKADMVKDIHIQIEREVVKVMEAAQWNKISSAVLEQIKEAVEGRVASMSQSSASKVAPEKLVQKRKSEKMRWAATGLVLGGLLYFVAQVVMETVQSDNNPLQTRAISEAKKRQEDLERRRFNPTQADEVKDTYTDSVIYTRNYAEVYLDQNFQQRLYKASAHYLLRTWRIEEEKSLQVLSAANALVKELQDRKMKIHPDYIKEGIEKMRVFESQTVLRMKEILGSEVRLESFRRFEKNFYREEVERRRTAQH